jgi:hypothetical protein
VESGMSVDDGVNESAKKDDGVKMPPCEKVEVESRKIGLFGWHPDKLTFDVR